MLVRPVSPEEKTVYNSVVDHPLQTWEWGSFRLKTGLEIERVGLFENGVLQKGLEVTFHPIPHMGYSAGYCPKGYTPDEEQLSILKQLGEKHRALFIKLEPNVSTAANLEGKQPEVFTPLQKIMLKQSAQPGRPLFTKYSFLLDLRPTEEELFAQLKSKTRYNVRLAQKKGVSIFENTSKDGLEMYLDILKETTSRQGFYAHSPEYFRTMWEELGSTGMMRIFNAVYDNQVLVSWIMFIHNGVLYYPYGASRRAHQDVMASNLMMWEMIQFGKREGCTLFDMWGSLGPEPDKKSPWYGFHRFKEGYGGQLVEFLGTYDLVLNQPLYKVFRVVENLRWWWLRLRARLPF